MNPFGVIALLAAFASASLAMWRSHNCSSKAAIAWMKSQEKNDAAAQKAFARLSVGHWWRALAYLALGAVCAGVVGFLLGRAA